MTGSVIELLSVNISSKLTFSVIQVGKDGAGHYVKMVHNGIEYGDMQLICEACHIMQEVIGLSNDEISGVSLSCFQGMQFNGSKC